MSRSIELGRAVLGSPANDYELWLTTLITVSPKQDATYLQQLKSTQFLDLLMSGVLWVSRGHEMHIEMRLNLRDEPLPPKQLHGLTNAILHAPVWNQLMLKPTQRTGIAVDPGTIYLEIHHSFTTGLQEQKRRHRIFSDVPAVDMQPPKGILSVSLQSIRMSMDILESSPRRRLTTKRLNSSPSERKAPALEEGEENSDTLLHKIAPNETLHDGYTNLSSSAPRVAAYRKRKRSAIETAESTQSGPHKKTETSTRKRRRSANSSIMQHRSRTNSTLADRIDVISMVDGALRLSICGTLNKTAVGWKTKANTFRLGLADIAPAMWRTGYLVALSQRTHLLPTIARSLDRIGNVKATSTSLSDKMKRLKMMALEASTAGHSRGSEPSANYGVAGLESGIAGRLWVQSQKNLLDRPMPPVQACVASSSQSSQLDSDDMLAEQEQEWHRSQRTSSVQDDGLHEFPKGLSSSTVYAQATQPQGRPFSSLVVQGYPREDEHDLLLDSHPPIAPLLPLSQSQSCRSPPLTAHFSLDQPAVANHDVSHELLTEIDMDRTEDLLLVS